MSLKEEKAETDTQREDGHVKYEVEIGLKHLQAEERQGPLAASEAKRKTWGHGADYPLEPSERAWPC